MSLFPQLGVSVRKEGWLQKRGDGNTLYSKRWCVLDSAFKLHYYKDKDSGKEQGVVDVTGAYAVSDTKQGVGFEIATPGRNWIFSAEDKDTQSGWMAALLAMMNDLREVKREMQAKAGFTILKAGEAACRDDLPDSDGAFVKGAWWELYSTGEPEG